MNLLVAKQPRSTEVGGFYLVYREGESPSAYVADREDARLFAAAPDLLKALKAILAERPELWGDYVYGGVTDFPISEDALFAADEAIAKAEGRREPVK